MKKVLVTGSSGYLGEEFIKSYKHSYEFHTFSLLKSSINDLKLENIYSILHCAALVHQKNKVSTYKDYFKINAEYPFNLAKKAKSQGVKQFIFISSIAVYDNSLNNINETSIKAPRTFYGKSKLEAEFFLAQLNDSSFKVSIIRPPMIYGYGAPGNINRLKQLIRYLKIIPLGGINNKRSFVYIKNLTFGINQVITQQSEGVFLMSDDESVSTTKLVRLIASTQKIYIIKIPFLKKILEIVSPNLYSKLYKDLIINNQMTKEKLNYKNPYTFEEGIKEINKKK